MTTSDSSSPGTSPGTFVTTQWTRVMECRGESPESAAALSDLCAAYYPPVLAFIRGSGREDDLARDLAQEFFARLLRGGGLEKVDPARGRFRSFLLGAVKHFLADYHDRTLAAKRGGGLEHLTIDGDFETSATLELPDPNAAVPDSFFDREWALTVVDRAINALAAEFEAVQKEDQFKVMKPWLLGDIEGVSQAEMARQLNITEGALKVAIHRLRRRYRDLVKREIAETVGQGVCVQDELRYLLEALSAST